MTRAWVWVSGQLFSVKRIIFFLSFFIILMQAQVDLSLAGSGEVLPKGVSQISLNSNFYLPIDERYDPDGHEENAAADLNAVLGSNAFPGLKGLEVPNLPFPVGLQPGTANIGTSVVSFDYRFTVAELYYQYGITDKLTAGAMIPYWWVKNKVTSRLDTSRATVGKDAGYNNLLPLRAPGTPGANPFLPGSNVQLLTTKDGQDLIGNGLDINRDGRVDVDPGLRFDPVAPWSDSGISDIKAWAKYQYYRSETWRLAFLGGVRFPTGNVDNPDNLVDYGFGNGAWGLLFQLHSDYTGFKNLVLNFTLKYDVVLPDKEVLRVTSPNFPLAPAANKDEVDRDIGDVFGLELSAAYELLDGLTASLFYEFGYKGKDSADGSRPDLNYASLEEETRQTQHVGVVSLSYSTIPLFRAGKFKVPLVGTLSYRNRFAGSGNVLKSEYIGLNITVFFQ